MVVDLLELLNFYVIIRSDGATVQQQQQQSHTDKDIALSTCL